MNLALKSILDRYSLMTLDLPQAEKELRDLFAERVTVASVYAALKPLPDVGSSIPMSHIVRGGTLTDEERVKFHSEWQSLYDSCATNAKLLSVEDVEHTMRRQLGVARKGDVIILECGEAFTMQGYDIIRRQCDELEKDSGIKVMLLVNDVHLSEIKKDSPPC